VLSKCIGQPLLFEPISRKMILRKQVSLKEIVTWEIWERHIFVDQYNKHACPYETGEMWKQHLAEGLMRPHRHSYQHRILQGRILNPPISYIFHLEHFCLFDVQQGVFFFWIKTWRNVVMHHRISSMHSCDCDGASSETIGEKKCKLMTMAL